MNQIPVKTEKWFEGKKLPRDKNITLQSEVSALRIRVNVLQDTIQDILKTQNIILDLIKTMKEGSK